MCFGSKSSSPTAPQPPAGNPYPTYQKDDPSAARQTVTEMGPEDTSKEASRPELRQGQTGTNYPTM
jgi:hypothetical protein